MRANFFHLALIATSLILVASSEAKINLETAMGIWLLDENTGKKVKDVSGNNNHGEIQGAKWAKGKFGSALKFNGKTDRVVIPNSDSLYAKKSRPLSPGSMSISPKSATDIITGKRSCSGNQLRLQDE